MRPFAIAFLVLVAGMSLKEAPRWIAVLATCVALASCATSAQREHERIQSTIASTSKESQACYTRVAALPRYAPIYSKIHVGAGPMPESMLLDDEHFSNEMLSLGLDWYAEKQTCDQIVFEGFGHVSNDLAVLGVGWAAESAKIVQDAVTNKPTYGELNKEIAALSLRERTEIGQWAVNMNIRLNLRPTAEVEAMQKQAMDAAGTALQSVLDTLVARQNALAGVQRAYIVEHPAYVPLRVIAPTTCRYTGTAGPLACS